MAKRKKVKIVEWSTGTYFPGIRIDQSMGPDAIRKSLRDFMDALKG